MFLCRFYHFVNSELNFDIISTPTSYFYFYVI